MQSDAPEMTATAMWKAVIEIEGMGTHIEAGSVAQAPKAVGFLL